MAEKKTKKKAKKVLCYKCTGLCCRYFALPIDTPEDREDYDDIRWYLCHENVSVFVEDDDWYVNIDNKCKHLSDKKYRCDIYNTRPKLCRGYTTKDCDLAEGEYDYGLHFLNDKQMDEYIRIKFDNNIKQKQKTQKHKNKPRKK